MKIAKKEKKKNVSHSTSISLALRNKNFMFIHFVHGGIIVEQQVSMTRELKISHKQLIESEREKHILGVS